MSSVSKKHILLLYSIKILLLATAIGSSLIGWGFYDTNTLVISTCLFLIYNIIFSLSRINDRIVFCVFQLTLFLFLMGGYIVNVLEGIEILHGYTTEVKVTTITGYMLTALTMSAYTIWEEFGKKHFKLNLNTNRLSWVNSDFTLSLQRVSAGVALITFCAAMLVSIEKIQFRSMYTLQEYYANYATSLPTIIYKLGDAYFIAFYTFLATLPTRRKAFLQIFLFLLYSASTLLYGVRHVLILNLFSFFIYCVLRNGLGEEKWLKKKTILVSSVFLPIMAMLLQSFDYIRRGAISLDLLDELLSFNLIKEFIVSQSITSNILAQAQVHMHLLGGQPVPYSLGNIYTYLTQNMVVRNLFDIPYIAQNSLSSALYGANLGSRLAYIIYPITYLQGVGMGSSFIAELYVDFSYIGIVLGSWLSASICVNIIPFMKKSPIYFAFGLICIRWLVYSPRDAMFNWLTKGFSIMNIIMIIGMALIAEIFIIRYSIGENR